MVISPFQSRQIFIGKVRDIFAESICNMVLAVDLIMQMLDCSRSVAWNLVNLTLPECLIQQTNKYLLLFLHAYFTSFSFLKFMKVLNISFS